MAFLTALCWAVLAIFLKLALNFSSSGTIVWVRLFFAWITVSLYLLWREKRALYDIKKMGWKAPLAGAFIAVNYYGFMKGIELTSASNAQVFIQLAPLGLALSGVLLFGETLTRGQLLGLMVTALGFLFFGRGQNFEMSLNNWPYWQGQIWIFLASVTWIVYSIWQKQLLRNWSINQINWMVFLVSSIALFPLANLHELTSIGWLDWLLLIFLSANTLCSYTALSAALKHAPATLVSVIITLNPILTLVLMYLINHMDHPLVRPEPIEWIGYLGAMIVVCGVIMVLTLRKRDKLIP